MPRTSSTDSDTASMFSRASGTSSATTSSSSTFPTSMQGPTISVHTTEDTQIVLPRILGKPQTKHIPREAIASINPDLASVPLAYIIRSLKILGPKMMNILSRTTAPPPHALPRELAISIALDASTGHPQFDILPTHLLAIYSRSENITPGQRNMPRRKVTLFPTHAIILAAHCAHLPLLPPGKKTNSYEINENIKSNAALADSAPPMDGVGQADSLEHTAEQAAGPSTLPDFGNALSSVLDPSTEPMNITLPVIPLCIPAPATFPILQAYLYTKRVDQLFASLIPNPSIQSHRQTDPMPAISSGEELSRQLADSLTTEALVRATLRTHALWANVCALGVFDEPLWQTMTLAWRVLLNALELAQECDSDDDAYSVDSSAPPENELHNASLPNETVDVREVTPPVESTDIPEATSRVERKEEEENPLIGHEEKGSQSQ